MKTLRARLYLLVAVAAVMHVVPTSAQTPRQVTWEDLAPSGGKPLEDPFAHLEPVLAAKLYGISAVRYQVAQGYLSPVSSEHEKVVETISELESEGVEVNALLARFEEVEAEIRRQESMVDENSTASLSACRDMPCRSNMTVLPSRNFCWFRMSGPASMFRRRPKTRWYS